MRVRIAKQVQGLTRFGIFQNLTEHTGTGHYFNLHLYPFHVEVYWKGRCWQA